MNSKCWVRDRRVGSTFCGSVVASTNTTCAGGSSSVFSSVFDAAGESMCTSSMMYTLRRLEAPTPRCTLWMSSRIASTPLFDAASSSTRSKNVPAATATQFSQVPSRLAVGAEVQAVEGAGQDARGGGLAGAARAGEEVGVADAVVADRVPERGRDVVLADQLREFLRPVLAVQAVRRHGSNLTDAH